MKNFRRNSLCQLLSFLTAITFVITSAPVTLFAQESSATKIKYEPIKYFVAGKRIRIAADVTDPEGIKLARCYFKGQEQADFVFVNMTAEGSTYTAILPAAAKNATSIKYLFLAVNNRNQVVKTQQFSVDKDDSQAVPPWQDVAMEGQLTVSTELAQVPAVLEGFADSIAMDLVESAARFGFVAGIYTSTQVAAAGGATGTAATATSAGTVSTAAAGMSTIAIVGITAGAVAAGGVAVAAGGGGSSSGGSSSGGSSSAPALFGASCNTFCSTLLSTNPTTFSSCSCSGTSASNAFASANLSSKCPTNGWGVTAKGWPSGPWIFNYFATSGYNGPGCTFSGDDTAFSNCINSIASAMVTYCSTP